MKKLIFLILFVGIAPVFAGDFDSDCLDQHNDGRAFVQEENTDMTESNEEEVNTESSGSDA